jgi:hypothetical protein
VNKRSVVRSVSVVMGLAAVAAVVLVSAGSAGTTTKPYTANLCDAGQLVGSVCPETTTTPPTLPGGSAIVYLTLHNKANPQTLGSANIGLPTGPSPTTYTGASISFGTGDITRTNTLVTLRNLNLAPNGFVTVRLTLSTPVCTSGTYDWSSAIQVKQSNSFNGPPGNDFTRTTPSSLTATLSGGGCHLAIVPDDSTDLTHQPKDTVKNQPITDGFYSGGNPVQVGVYDSSHNLIDLNGSCQSGPSGAGCVTVGFTGGDATATLSGTKQQALVHGTASFPGLKLDKTSTDLYGLTFSSPGITGTTSDGFAIVDDGCTATDGSCTVTGTFPKNGSTPTTTADATATFQGAGSLSLKFFLQGAAPTGCQQFIGTGSAGVDTTVQGSTTGFLITYGISDKALKQTYGPNFGQPNVPICVGAQRIVNGHPESCALEPQNSGWTGRTLGADGKPDGGFDHATCGSDGLWWNIAPTFQDTPPTGFPISIVISSWGSATASDGTALRTFTISKPPPWDGKCFG